MPDSPLRIVAELTQCTGPTECPVAACATGLLAMIHGTNMIRRGDCEVCVVGSGDASLRASVIAAFQRLGVTSRAADAATACRPFDQNRDGFVIGEGAAVCILESSEFAKARHARTDIKVRSVGSVTDPTGLTQIDASGDAVARLLRQLGPEKFDIVSLHGTGTEPNDLAEANGLRTVFPDQQIPAFATKGATGHLLGAAGSVEACLTALALRHRVVPPTRNHDSPMKNSPNLSSQARKITPGSARALKLSLGFGGHVLGCVLEGGSEEFCPQG